MRSHIAPNNAICSDSAMRRSGTVLHLRGSERTELTSDSHKEQRSGFSGTVSSAMAADDDKRLDDHEVTTPCVVAKVVRESNR